MANDFTQASLDAALDSNTIKELRKEYPRTISEHDQKSDYVQHLERYSIKMRAAMITLIFKGMGHLEEMMNEVGIDL